MPKTATAQPEPTAAPETTENATAALADQAPPSETAPAPAPTEQSATAQPSDTTIRVSAASLNRLMGLAGEVQVDDETIAVLAVLRDGETP